MKLRLLVIVVGLALVGCMEQPVSTRDRHSEAPVSPTKPPLVTEFVWGDATITLGMTRSEVLAQIARSGPEEWSYQFGIKAPSQDMQKQTKWTLSYGNGSGAAPGGGVVFFYFEDGKLKKIEMGSYYADGRTQNSTLAPTPKYGRYVRAPCREAAASTTGLELPARTQSGVARTVQLQPLPRSRDLETQWTSISCDL